MKTQIGKNSRSNISCNFEWYQLCLYIFTFHFPIKWTNQYLRRFFSDCEWLFVESSYNLFPREGSLNTFPLLTDIPGNVFFKPYRSGMAVIRNMNCSSAVVTKRHWCFPLSKSIDFFFFLILACIINRHWGKSSTRLLGKRELRYFSFKRESCCCIDFTWLLFVCVYRCNI